MTRIETLSMGRLGRRWIVYSDELPAEILALVAVGVGLEPRKAQASTQRCREHFALGISKEPDKIAALRKEVRRLQRRTL